MDKNIYLNILDKIKSANKILVVTHENPDGDALSSSCAIIELLKSLNKKYSAYCFNKPPYQFDFLPNVEKFTTNKNNFESFDLIITLDCGALNRTKLEDEINNRNKNQTVINIDHHIKMDDFADIELKNTKATSTAEIVYDLFEENKIIINKNIANCILTGILTDTGNFLYPSTSQKSVKISSEMLSKGARLPKIMENTWRNKSLASMKIWGKAMSRLRINKKYNFAFSVLTKKDIAESEADEEELEGIVGFLSNLNNVKGVMLLREQPNNVIKGSLRTSCPDVDVAKLAQSLGGGGHVKASGFKIEGTLIQKNNTYKII
ncbi:MAG: bifunctional oligoribonuclease/PAP phosphatase NrnA [Candidatus Falkowbacteria bacterium]